MIEQALPWEFRDLEGLRSTDPVTGAVSLLSEGAPIPAAALGTTVACSRRWLLVSSLSRSSRARDPVGPMQERALRCGAILTPKYSGRVFPRGISGALQI